MKTCTKCNIELPIDCFGIKNGAKASKDGRRPSCKQCHNAESKTYRAANPDAVRETKRNYDKRNPDKKKASDRSYWQRHSVERKAYFRKWHSENSEYLRQYRSTDAYKERKRLHDQQYNERYPQVGLAIQTRRRQAKISGGVFELRAKDIKRLRSKPCHYCGERKKIELDHVIALARGGRHSIGNLLPACRSCNASKSTKTIMEWRLIEKA